MQHCHATLRHLNWYVCGNTSHTLYQESKYKLQITTGLACFQLTFKEICFFSHYLAALEEKVVIYYEKKRRPSVKGCYVKRDRKVYPENAVWHPFVQPFGYMRCHACTCMVSGSRLLIISVCAKSIFSQTEWAANFQWKRKCSFEYKILPPTTMFSFQWVIKY